MALTGVATDKKALRNRWAVVFVDESGFMLQPTIRKMWAPRGQAPILECYDRRGRLTDVSALSVSPQCRRLGLLFDILDHNLLAEDFDLFDARLLRKIRGPVTLFIHRLGADRAAVRSLQARYAARLEVERLPPLFGCGR